MKGPTIYLLQPGRFPTSAGLRGFWSTKVPDGNTSLFASVALAWGLDRDQILVVQATEYTAAGKLPSSQLTIAKKNGIAVLRGNPRISTPGKDIVIPENLNQIEVEGFDMEKIRLSYFEKALESTVEYTPSDEDILFLAEDSKSTVEFVREAVMSVVS